MLSKRAITELRKELDRLVAQRNQIDQQIGGIQLLLGPSGGSRIRKPRQESKDNETTFASHVRAALADIGRRANAKDVAAILRNQGIGTARACTLEVAVSAELNRMANRRTRGVKKVSRGMYRIEKQEAQ